MKEIFLVLIGGVCSALGGFVAVWYQVKNARKIRMEEVRGEQQLGACKKALSLIDQVCTLYIQSTEEDVLKIILDNGEWFSMNQVLLPHTFVENWRSIRINLRSMLRKNISLEKAQDETKQEAIKNDIIKTDKFIGELIEEADEVLRKELEMPKVNIKTPAKENG